jgi:propanediol dehydratase small subunit
MTADLSRLDVQLPVLEAELTAAQFERAAEHTHSPSDQIAFHLDAWLVTHPDACATSADYPGWAEQFAAIKTAHSSKETA